MGILRHSFRLPAYPHGTHRGLHHLPAALLAGRVPRVRVHRQPPIRISIHLRRSQQSFRRRCRRPLGLPPSHTLGILPLPAHSRRVSAGEQSVAGRRSAGSARHSPVRAVQLHGRARSALSLQKHGLCFGHHPRGLPSAWAACSPPCWAGSPTSGAVWPPPCICSRLLAVIGAVCACFLREPKANDLPRLLPPHARKRRPSVSPLGKTDGRLFQTLAFVPGTPSAPNAALRRKARRSGPRSALSGLEAVLGQPAEFAQPFVNLIKQRVPGKSAVLAATPHRHAGKQFHGFRNVRSTG